MRARAAELQVDADALARARTHDDAQAANPYGCNRYGHRCPQKGTTREGETKPKQSKAQNKQKSSESPKKPPLVTIDKPLSTKTGMIDSMRVTRDKMSHVEGSTRVANTNRGSVAPGMKEAFFITGKTIGECAEKVNESADEVSHYTAAAHIDILWENSAPLCEEDDRYNSPKDSSLEKVYKRTTTMRINSEIYSVKITAKKFKDKNVLPILYTVKTEKSRQ